MNRDTYRVRVRVGVWVRDRDSVSVRVLVTRTAEYGSSLMRARNSIMGLR